MKKAIILVLLVAVIVTSIVPAVSASGVTITYEGIYVTSCNDDEITFILNIPGLNSSHYIHSTTDANGLRYQDQYYQYLAPQAGWGIYASNSGGPTTGTFPLPVDTPIYYTLQILDGDQGPVIAQFDGVIQSCNSGIVVYTNSTSVGGMCANALPANSVQYRVPAGAPVYYAADSSTLVTWTLAPGTYWITQFSGDFAQVWQTCQGQRFWIPSSAVSR